MPLTEKEQDKQPIAAKKTVKRKRAVRKKKKVVAEKPVDELVANTSPVEVAEKSDDNSADVVKPKRKARRPAAKTRAKVETEANENLDEDAPKKPKRAPRRKAVKKKKVSDDVTPETIDSPEDKVEASPKETPIVAEKAAEAREEKPKTRDKKTVVTDETASAQPSETDEHSRRPRKRGGRGRGRRGQRKGPGQEQEQQQGERQSKEPVDKPKSQTQETEAEDTRARVAHRIDTVLHTSSEARKAIRTKGKGRDMIINTTAGDECRIAVLHEGRLEELFIERSASASHVGSIYKGVITNVEPSIQAAFIDFGLQKNGFLHISDVQPQYFPNHQGEHESVGQKIPRHKRPPIQNCFRRGQEVIVQIIKEGVGTKGPTLTTYLSIPGRYLVMMPGMSKHGVSRKIEDDESRRTMRDLLNELILPPDMGFIARTAGLGQNKRDLQRDLNYLQRLWKTVVERVMKMAAPAELYRESDLVTRTIRDVYSSDYRRIMIDSQDTAAKVREFLQIAMPRTKVRLELYDGHEPLFHSLGIEDEIDSINQRHVPLPSGGSLVIDSTEALVAIDVNSGRSRSIKDAEESAFRLNVEAAEEIARQLRLRDLGGLIVCDFIDMRLDRNKRAVERALRDALKDHKERARILRISAFGLIEITRQRQGPSMKRSIYSDCPHCRGGGVVKTPDSVVLDIMRSIQLAAHKPAVKTIQISVSNAVAYLILNDKRAALHELEEKTEKRIQVRGESSFTSDQVEYAFLDAQSNPARISLTEGSRR